MVRLLPFALYAHDRLERIANLDVINLPPSASQPSPPWPAATCVRNAASRAASC